ncbi:hemin uptake protein HemP [Citreimonas sp.]|uniref:hemin uptake protein HemP n=1 Tax=Citreimonas sp. TaxID=3036715 RepID=UPI0035C7D723
MQSVPNPRIVEDADGTAVYDARDLIANGVKAEIVLDGQTYTLRITRAGKLILTK